MIIIMFYVVLPLLISFWAEFHFCVLSFGFLFKFCFQIFNCRFIDIRYDLWWMTAMNKCVWVSWCVCERRNASMVVTPWFGSCIPQPRLKLRALAWLARMYFVDCLSCSKGFTLSCFELHPAAAFEAACSCVFRTFAVSFLFVMTMMIIRDDHDTCIVEGVRMSPSICLAFMWSVSARDCEDMVTMAARIARWCEIFGCELRMKFYSNSISVHIMQLLTFPPPTLFVLKNHISSCWIESRMHVCICCMVEQPFWGYGQW